MNQKTNTFSLASPFSSVSSFQEGFDNAYLNSVCSDREDYEDCIQELISKNTDLSSQQSQIQKWDTQIGQTRAKLLNQYNTYNTANQNSRNYEVIDDSGNLIFKKNTNFKSSIPSLKDAVFEDTSDLVNYQKNIYLTSSLIATGLIIIAIFIVR